MENCIRVGGVPAIWQTDSTGSVKNKAVESDPIASVFARAGTTIVHPAEVGNSQANGICENYNTYLDREARELATYQGKYMDSLTLRRVRKLTTKMVKAGNDLVERDRLRREAEKQGKGLVFNSYAEAVEWINSKVHKSNNTPHRSLPKVRSEATGRMEHMTPQQALDAAKAAGWKPVMLDEASLIDLFRPHVRKTVVRETVSPFGGQRYCHPVLGDFNGEEVMVAVDPLDASCVWVKSLEGELLCEATFLESTGYRCLSMYEWAMERRANVQIKRRVQKIEQIERRMTPALEASAAQIDVIGPVRKSFGMKLDHALAEITDARMQRPTAAEHAPQKLQQPPQEAPAQPRHRADFSDLAMSLYGDQIKEETEKPSGMDSTEGLQRMAGG